MLEMSITGTAFQTAIIDQIFSERNSLAKTFPKKGDHEDLMTDQRDF